jgi:hypothetical protein
MGESGFGRTSDGGIELRIHPVLVGPISQMVGDLTELIATLDPESDGRAEDPLAALVGIEPDAGVPEDPAVARLFPDAYVGDEESASEFRRFTRRTMRETKARNAEVLLGTLERAEVRLTLTEDEALAWLKALNDVRLVLGSRLGITQENAHDVDDLDEIDGTRYFYEILGFLQSSLIDTLAGDELEPDLS